MIDHPHYITPEEAEDLYCPISMGAIEGKDLCAGPQCMAWRWRLMRYAEEKDPETDSWPAIYSTTHGRCGMAERP